MVHELGTVGMVCPFPLIEAQNKMDELSITLKINNQNIWYT